MDWDNLRYFLELSRTGTLTAAARRLEVNYTTVARRIQALEKSLGVRLFLREATGYSLTDAGQDFLRQVEAMEGTFAVIENNCEEVCESLSGHVRIGVTEGYASLILAPQLAKLTRQYPSLSVDLLVVPRRTLLSRREVDIIIAMECPKRGLFITTRLTDYVLKLYASADYLGRYPPIRSKEDLCEHSFVSYIDDLLYNKELSCLNGIGQHLRVALRSSCVLAQQQAVASGAGIAILPAFAADTDACLQRILDQQVSFISTFWMLMPNELKNVERMRVTWSFLQEIFKKDSKRLMGEAVGHR